MERPIEEIWKDLCETRRYDVKRVRHLHKELVEGFGRKAGVPFQDRYPLFGCYLSIASLLVAIVTVFIISVF